MNKKEIKYPKNVKIGKSIFDSNIAGERDGKRGLANGGCLHFDVPEECGLIVLAGNKGGGYEPYSSLLPHQVYVDDIKKTFEETGFEVIYAMPINSRREPFPIAFNGDYGRQRWEEKPRQMSEEEHKNQHNFLHRMLDELVADFIMHTENLPSKTTIYELMKWSASETKKPTSK